MSPRHELTCPRCGTDEHTVGVEVTGVYDGILFWRCTACRTAWHRWPEGHWQHERAVPFVTLGRTEAT